ncbi:hypothetical protein D9M71_813070 [compost metagenome]
MKGVARLEPHRSALQAQPEDIQGRIVKRCGCLFDDWIAARRLDYRPGLVKPATRDPLHGEPCNIQRRIRLVSPCLEPGLDLPGPACIKDFIDLRRVTGGR